MTLKEEDRRLLLGHYREKSRAAAENVEFLIENDKLQLAVNQIYYGMFYMLSALAIKHHFETSRHKQLIGWFNKTFIKGGKTDKRYSKLIQKAYDNRMEGDYDVFATFSRDEVEQSFVELKDVMEVIEKLIDA
ncbi:MAG: HEPN domain-containing protein [bacterium]|nr:HEPN domain-containing protein [bacterium]